MPSGPWQSSCKQLVWIPEPGGGQSNTSSHIKQELLAQGFFCKAGAEETKALTPTFRSKSLTMLRAEILAEGVSGELLTYPFDKTVQGRKKTLFIVYVLCSVTKYEHVFWMCVDQAYWTLSILYETVVELLLFFFHMQEFATCLVGEGVVQSFAQRGGRQRQRSLNSRVALHAVLSRGAGSRHPAHVRLPLAHRQLLTQV